MIEAIERQIKPAILAVMTSVAALTGVGAGKVAPQNGVNRSVKQAPTVQRGKTVRYGKQVPGVQVVKGVSSQEKRIKSGAVRHHSTPQILIPDMPELKFSNKLATFPVTEVNNAEYYRQQKYYSDISRYNAIDRERCFENEILRAAAPYVPDIFYEKAQLPYAERIKFIYSSERKKIITALRERFETNIGARKVWGETPLMVCIEILCGEMLRYGRPLATLPTETQSLREAVDLCGMTQLGLWLDIQKAKNREFKDIIPEGYNEKEAQEQQRYLGNFRLLFYGDQYEKAAGIRVENPIRSDCPYFTKDDFAHLSPKQRDDLLDLWRFLSPTLRIAPELNTADIYQEYLAIKRDQTGYRYVQQQRPGLSREQAQKVQQLSLEMVIYKRPLALLRAEDYSLEQVMKVCHFRLAEGFYEMQQQGLRRTGEVSELGFTMGNLEANALINLGKRYNHSDWVEFGQEMYKACQNRIVVKNINRPLVQKVIKLQETVRKHDDSQMIQNQAAKMADEPRVREQDDSTNATSRVKSNANKGMK